MVILTQFSAVFAVDVLHLIAFVIGAFELIKDETIITQLFCCHSAGADVIFITLEFIRILTVLGRTSERLSYLLSNKNKLN